MELSIHNMNSLFSQLGQPSDDEDIARFVANYRPLANGVQLHEASFWTSSQADFLRDAVRDDADWAEVVDELNAELHARQ